MKLLVALLFLSFLPAAVDAACIRGAYGTGPANFVVIGPLPDPATGERYLFADGRRGSTADAASPIVCEGNFALVEGARWPKIRMRETPTSFESRGTKLGGMLIEPIAAPAGPLVVMVHGSERSPAIAGRLYPYALAAQGISVFVYDKRGTGISDGHYTQNFELLADDASAALGDAQRLLAGRYTRSGYFGGSQGGWVAPLAATRSRADFVAVGFGLVTSPVGEDREQMIAEARAAGLGPEAFAAIDRLSQATSKLVSSHFVTGYDDLARVRRDLSEKPWAKTIKGEYSGDMLRMSDADLRRIGQPLFDNLELIWDYDSVAPLRRLNMPLLWVLAGEDREAPIDTTRKLLTGLIASGEKVDLYLFPDTDHGMFEFTTLADGSRKVTRITDGYFRLLGDWIKGEVKGPYGRAERLR